MNAMAQAPKRRRLGGFFTLPMSDRIFLSVIYALLGILFVAFAYPILYVVSASVSDPVAVSTGEMLLFPVGFNLKGYEAVFNYHKIWMGYANTLLYTVAGTLCNLLCTIPTAYALSKKSVPGRNFVMTLFVITMYFGGGLIPSYLNMQELGLVNTRWIMIIGGAGVSYLIICRTFFVSFPHEMEEAAMIDGCGAFRMFLKIVLPTSSALVAVMALYYAVSHWNTFFTAMIYLHNEDYYPLQLFLRRVLIQAKAVSEVLEGASEEELKLAREGEETANLLKYCMMMVSTAPMLILFPFIEKFFAQGVMIGSLKG